MSVETDPHGNLRIRFRLPGYPKDIKIAFGLPDTVDNRRAAERTDKLARKLSDASLRLRVEAKPMILWTSSSCPNAES